MKLCLLVSNPPSCLEKEQVYVLECTWIPREESPMPCTPPWGAPALSGWDVQAAYFTWLVCIQWDEARVGQPSGGQWTPLPGWPGGLHTTVCFLGMKQNKIQPYWVLNELYWWKKNCRVSAGFWVQQLQSRTLAVWVPAVSSPGCRGLRQLSRFLAHFHKATWTCLSMKEMEVTPCAEVKQKQSWDYKVQAKLSGQPLALSTYTGESSSP